MADWILREDGRVDLMLCGVRFRGVRMRVKFEDATEAEIRAIELVES